MPASQRPGSPAMTARVPAGVVGCRGRQQDAEQRDQGRGDRGVERSSGRVVIGASRGSAVGERGQPPAAARAPASARGPVLRTGRRRTSPGRRTAGRPAGGPADAAAWLRFRAWTSGSPDCAGSARSQRTPPPCCWSSPRSSRRCPPGRERPRRRLGPSWRLHRPPGCGAAGPTRPRCRGFGTAGRARGLRPRRHRAARRRPRQASRGLTRRPRARRGEQLAAVGGGRRLARPPSASGTHRGRGVPGDARCPADGWAATLPGEPVTPGPPASSSSAPAAGRRCGTSCAAAGSPASCVGR